MSAGTQVFLGENTHEEDLRLPRPPGVIRQFWARHPIFADVLLVVLTLLLTVPTLALSDTDLPVNPLLGALWILITLVTAGALMWRRRYPITVYAITFAPTVLMDPALSTTLTGIAPMIALYSVAVYRSTRAAMWALAASVVASVIIALAWGLSGATAPEAASSLVFGSAVLLLIGALIGVNVGGRKRYVEALIDRSRQLAVERDQQAQLATAAERNRIAREMHDIVSHSLAVVVALAEGAHATDDLARAKQANRAIADTARESLAQMRVMLGVLRTGSDAASDSPGAAPMTTAGARNSEDGPRNGELRRDPPNLGASSESQSDAAPYSLPLAPLLTQTPADVVARARDAGLPVTLTVSGTPGGSDRARLAVLRIVQEGLTNALRYAHDPGRVHVTIEYAGARVHVRIENDGVRAGETSRGAGLGIRGLQERVSALDGTVQAGPFGEASWRLEAEFDSEERND